MDEDELTQRRHDAEWDRQRQAQLDEIASEGGAHRIRDLKDEYAATQEAQAAWQANVERLLQGNDAQRAHAQMLLDTEWQGVRFAQALELGDALVSPMLRLRLSLALTTRDDLDAAEAGDLSDGGFDYIETARELMYGRGIEDHVGWLHSLDGREWPDALQRSWRDWYEGHFAGTLPDDGDDR